MYLVSTGAVRAPSCKADRLGFHENHQINQNPQAGSWIRQAEAQAHGIRSTFALANLFPWLATETLVNASNGICVESKGDSGYSTGVCQCLVARPDGL